MLGALGVAAVRGRSLCCGCCLAAPRRRAQDGYDVLHERAQDPSGAVRPVDGCRRVLWPRNGRDCQSAHSLVRRTQRHVLRLARRVRGHLALRDLRRGGRHRRRDAYDSLSRCHHVRGDGRCHAADPSDGVSRHRKGRCRPLGRGRHLRAHDQDLGVSVLGPKARGPAPRPHRPRAQARGLGGHNPRARRNHQLACRAAQVNKVQRLPRRDRRPRGRRLRVPHRPLRRYLTCS
eukprot:Amastigsp_a325_18.p3 type:complete len:233 gc:universal Amastigsp_a325_18:1533-2231(+)